MAVHRVGTRATFPFLAARYWRSTLRTLGFDVLVEDINKVPLWTPRWGARRVVVVRAITEAADPAAAAAALRAALLEVPAHAG